MLQAAVAYALGAGAAGGVAWSMLVPRRWKLRLRRSARRPR